MSFDLEFQSFPPPDGPLRYAKVPWDSETFGHSIYELQCAALPPILRQHVPPLLAALSVERPVLVWTKTAVDDATRGLELAGLGFYPVETLIELHLSLARFKPVVARTPDGLRLRPATEADLPRLCILARTAFRSDRYHVDPHLDKDRANERFVHWLQRAMRDAEPVFAYEDAGKGDVIGFYHLREQAVEPKTVYLSLAALDPESQKLGFGLLLYQAVLIECQARGYVTALTHVSVNNLDVLNVFARLGCSVRNPVMTWHWYR